MIAVMATLRAKPGRRGDLLDALRPSVADAHDEAGTLVFALHEDGRDENLIHFYELYESKEAFITHVKAAGPKLNAFADLMDGAPELTQSVPITAKGLELYGIDSGNG